MKKCGAITSGGQRCQRIINDSESYCFGHDPTRAEQRKQYAAKAAKAKNAGSELVQIKSRLRQLSEEVIEGKVPTAKASVAAQVLGYYLRATEVQMKLKAQEELEQRLAQLEASYGGGGSKGWR